MRSLKTTTSRLRQGFTFIELSLAILFVSLLALAVALVTSNISKIYSKGLTVKAINSTGSDLIEELTASIQQAPATQLSAFCETLFHSSATQETACKNNYASLFTFYQATANVRLKDEPFTDGAGASNIHTVQTTGAFCTGKYSYIWNTGYANNNLYVIGETNTGVSGATITYKYHSGAAVADGTASNFRLVRFEDPSRVACASRLVNYGTTSVSYRHATPTDGTYEYNYNITKTQDGSNYILPNPPEELLPATENALSLYSLYAAPPSQDSTTNRLLYSGSFILATLRGGVKITNTHDFCEVESGLNDDFEYCSINKFNFAVQALGASNK